MVIVNSYTLAVILLFVTMICWGSWANFQKATSNKWPFQFFYIDFTIGILISILFISLTFGSIGLAGRSFINDILQANLFSLFNSFLSGFIWSFGTLLLVAAISIAGMAVAFPIGIGVALILGVTTNYIKEPIGNELLLATGVILLLFAILLDSIAYRRNTDKNIDKGGVKGILISILAGCILGFVIRLMMNSISFDFSRPKIGLMTPYTASFVFSIGAFTSNFFGNLFLIRKNIISNKKIIIKNYFANKNNINHLYGLLAGLVWSIGWILNMLSAGIAGFAIADALGQGATMIAALWGLLVWKEFKKSNKLTLVILFMMFVFYISGLSVIILSRYY